MKLLIILLISITTLSACIKTESTEAKVYSQSALSSKIVKLEGHYIVRSNEYRSDLSDGELTNNLFVKSSDPFIDHKCKDINKDAYMNKHHLNDSMTTEQMTYHFLIKGDFFQMRYSIETYHKKKIIGLVCNFLRSEGNLEYYDNEVVFQFAVAEIIFPAFSLKQDGNALFMNTYR